MMSTEFVLFAVPVVMAIAQISKEMGLPKRFTPLFNIAVGVVGAIFYAGVDIKMAVLNGIIIGLTASGVYSGVKNTIQK